MSDWERDTGVPWPYRPLGRPVYSRHHYRGGRLLVGQYGPWRRRDRLARFFNFHCWECWRNYR